MNLVELRFRSNYFFWAWGTYLTRDLARGSRLRLAEFDICALSPSLKIMLQGNNKTRCSRTLLECFRRGWFSSSDGSMNLTFRKCFTRSHLELKWEILVWLQEEEMTANGRISQGGRLEDLISACIHTKNIPLWYTHTQISALMTWSYEVKTKRQETLGKLQKAK